MRHQVMTRRVHAPIAAGLLALVALSACASPEADGVAAAATRFAAFSATAPDKACLLLAPGTRRELEDSSKSRCGKALPEQKLPGSARITAVDVAGDSARVVTASQTLFLARFDAGWKVTAAGCKQVTADDAKPYTCLVKGS